MAVPAPTAPLCPLHTPAPATAEDLEDPLAVLVPPQAQAALRKVAKLLWPGRAGHVPVAPGELSPSAVMWRG